MIRGPHRCKKNQRVMNSQQSTSISGKHQPENLRGEGATCARTNVQESIRADLAEDVGEFLRHLAAQFGAGAGDHGKVLEPLERAAGVDHRA